MGVLTAYKTTSLLKEGWVRADSTESGPGSLEISGILWRKEWGKGKGLASLPPKSQVPAFKFSLSSSSAAAGGVGSIVLWKCPLQWLPASTRWALLRDGAEDGWNKDYISH